MGFGTNAGIFFFNLLMLVFTLLAFLVAKVCVLSGYCKPLTPKSWRHKLTLVTTCLMWRAVLFLSFWIETDVDGLSEYRSALGASGRPVVVIANHMSFMDTILIVTLTSLAKISRVRMLVSGHLLKMPVLGTIVQAMGHKAVPFKATGADGSFELDKELMAKRQKELELHTASGGVAAWYPEGMMNRGDPREVLTFRAGGFSLAVNLDVEIWCLALHNTSVCWPRTAAVGGRPTKIGVKVIKLCESSHAFITDAKIDLGNERAASIHIANCARERVQSAVNQMASVN